LSQGKRRISTKEGREAQQGWFESWSNQSPWLATLISTLLGPLIKLMSVLTFGPCVLNKLLTFVKSRINAVQLMVMRQQYLELKDENDSIFNAAREAVTRFDQQI
ncbi:ENV1 protein, partial [Columbina picui]|nr:ENV1 protein [Columbina picui]